MNQQDAKRIIEQGITFGELREMMLHEYDGKPAATIRDWTRSDAHLFLRSLINDMTGTVDPESWQAYAAELILREFGEDRSDQNSNQRV
jgi:hypothetical protein